MPNRQLALIAFIALFAGVASPAAAADQKPTHSTPLTAMALVKPIGAVCGNSAILDGPATPPPGSVVINPGTNLNDATMANPAGTTFYLTAGTHTLGSSEYGQVV
ncbi:MAG TPA: hypothetical protein VGR26_09570, partial [Acidimicrobiales bacterium]|nr:hypothetical protein [Acidimicrobiales bacterium]